MNKVFKVIWSEARNAYVVVSEMAKSHGTKSCSTKKLLAMLIATGVMTCASVAPAMAANLAPNDTKIEVGKDASASGQGSVAIGNNAQASGLVGIAIGRDAVASGTDSIAIGSSTKAGQTYSVAVGNDIGFTAYAGTAVGQQAYASGDNATAIGTMTNVDAKYNASHDDWRKAGAQSTAIGAYAGSWGLASTAVGGFSKAEGKLATAIGYNSQANVDYGTALGDYSEVTAGWGVAIGASSVADREAGVVGAFAPEGADSLTWRANGGAVSVGSATLTRQITNLAAGVADTDAVNVGQLKEAVEAGNTDTHIKPGEYGVDADNTVNMDVVDKNGNKVDTVTIKDVAKASDVGDVNNIASDIKNQDGSHTTVVDAVNNLNNKVGDLNYVEGGKGNYVTNGENTTTSIGKLDKALKDVADTAAKHTKVEGGNNITVTNTAKEGEAANYKVELNKDIDVDTVTANTVTTGQTVMNNDGVKVGTDVSLNKDGLKVGDKVSVSATAVTAGQTSINNDGLAVGPNTSLKADELKVDGKTYIDKNGLNANGMQITNVADGKENSDAVNVGQLKESEKTINNRIDGVENQVVNNTNRINKLGSRVNKVGAGAAALAALHPMDFDPDDKLTFSAGYGNYAGENAAAIGAYYRPDEKVMFSVAGTVGNGENMVNAGVSFALDRTNHVSNSRTALAREVIDLRGQLAVMGAKMAKMEKAFGMLDETKTKLFPDVPANHWAYEYIAKLAGNGYIEGYPDGNFGGDRLMTRYEFAAMLYRAIENGAALEEKIIKEFEPELGRIRVDRISGEDGDRDKIERVRVNDTKGERDHYGNKLAK